MRISETVVSDIFQNVQEDSSGSSISFNGSLLQNDLELFDLPVKSNLISKGVSVSSAHAVIMDTVADSNYHIDLSLDDCDNNVVEEVCDSLLSDATSSSSILCEDSFCRSLL